MEDKIKSKKEFDEQREFELFENRVLSLLEQWRVSKRPVHRRINKILLSLNVEFDYTGYSLNK